MNSLRHSFGTLDNREIIAQFNGGCITSDAGALLLHDFEKTTGIIKQFANCFTDYRDNDRIEHSVEELIAQRIYGIILGYEDLNDHDRLKSDQLLALVCGKDDPTGDNRRRNEDKGNPLAGKSTLNRLELSAPDADKDSRYKKIVANLAKMDELLVNIFLNSHVIPPKQIVLDLDTTDDIAHGKQENIFYHGYYKNYCYLPLYIFCGNHILCARLRPCNIDASSGTIEELSWIIEMIRNRWPNVEIIVRGDSAFCRDEIMSWCEFNEVNYVFGLSKNNRLKKIICEDLIEARIMFTQTGKASRIYNDFTYQTLSSWEKERRVISKSEYMSKGENPRFIVTSLPNTIEAKELYEDIYCARGDMENRIKEQQLDLFADRTSTHQMRANQIRLYMSSIAYTILNLFREKVLNGTELENAQCGTIRTKILKIGAEIKVTVRKIWIEMNENYPYQELYLIIKQKINKIYRYITQFIKDKPK